MFVKPVPPKLISFVFHAVTLKPLKKYISKLKVMCKTNKLSFIFTKSPVAKIVNITKNFYSYMRMMCMNLDLNDTITVFKKLCFRNPFKTDETGKLISRL